MVTGFNLSSKYFLLRSKEKKESECASQVSGLYKPPLKKNTLFHLTDTLTNTCPSFAPDTFLQLLHISLIHLPFIYQESPQWNKPSIIPVLSSGCPSSRNPVL